ncbi:hypothetical protein C8F04DRAFT_960153 [Mycena alexandri]|uniref:F-box domain-containing protein n=1 Tax=Mycena alexandri TaxID=1745969 RepID=A0AAD6X492_9AGAR|nr:hypothetical protein C8F04DRAFT_960153 [Mycena alexandri]
MDHCFRLVDLPPELLVHIFTFLPKDAIHCCRQTSRYLCEFIESSIELRYQVARELAYVTDNPASILPISERIARLSARESGFSNMTPSWVRTIPVPFRTAGLYELSGGLFWLGESGRQALRYVVLPTEPPGTSSPPIQWERIASSSSQSRIIDFGLAIDEHDLVVIATFTPTAPVKQLEALPLIQALAVSPGVVKLEFVTVSSPSGPHPQAKGSIEFPPSHWGIPSAIILECVGDILVFIVAYPRAPLVPDHVYIYNWKAGMLLWELTAENSTYFGAVFLSTDVLMLPNTTTATLELWLLTAGQTAPVLTLHLPRLVPGTRIANMTARGEPNPSVSGRKNPRMPFHSSVEDSIIVFNITFPAPPNVFTPVFLFFVHRRTLLSLLAAHPTPGDALNYADWGPDICRWINAGGLVTDWITTTSGQRCIALPVREPASFLVLDFNPLTVHAASSVLPAEDDPFEDYGIWAEAVGSRLPVHVMSSRQQYNSYNGVSLDDARIIAFKVRFFFLSLSRRC